MDAFHGSKLEYIRRLVSCEMASVLLWTSKQENRTSKIERKWEQFVQCFPWSFWSVSSNILPKLILSIALMAFLPFACIVWTDLASSASVEDMQCNEGPSFWSSFKRETWDSRSLLFINLLFFDFSTFYLITFV